MGDTIRIGSWQGPIRDGEPEANIATVLSVLERHAGLDFLLFPETFLTGYRPPAVRDAAMSLDDPRITLLARETGRFDTVVMVGLSERSGQRLLNTQLVLYHGAILGVHRKWIMTSYDKTQFAVEKDAAVFEAKGVKFGVAICHESSFVEPALCLRWQGARLLFTPHYDDLPPLSGMGAEGGVTFWEHRTMVLNNQAALATLLKMVVVRSDVITLGGNRLGFGDSGIWDMNGTRLAVGEPFREGVITAEFPTRIFQEEHWISRADVPPELLDMIAAAARRA